MYSPEDIGLAFFIGRRVFRQDWFAHSIAEFSESQATWRPA
ncbi:MAG TPA: hypothetical protein VF114_07390 [Candidatus Limnocylindria bacterium]